MTLKPNNCDMIHYGILFSAVSTIMMFAESMGSLPAVIRWLSHFCRVIAERHGHQLAVFNRFLPKYGRLFSFALLFPSLFRLRKRLGYRSIAIMINIYRVLRSIRPQSGRSEVAPKRHDLTYLDGYQINMNNNKTSN